MNDTFVLLVLTVFFYNLHSLALRRLDPPASYMKPSKTTNLQKVFFFDLPLSDVYGIGCAALRLIYHGSEEGVFGSTIKEAFDLDSIEAFQISLRHRIVEPLSKQYDYNLVYYRKELARTLWDSGLRRGCPTLRKLTRRVTYSDKRSLEPNRLRRFYIKSNRPIHVAKYSKEVPTDHYVPMEYIQEFGERFEGYLMRSKRGFPLVSRLFEAQGLSMAERRDIAMATETTPHVLAFTRDSIHSISTE